jgi:hypothetical protein
LKWLPGGFDIPTQTPRNASSHIIYFLSFRSVFSSSCLLCSCDRILYVRFWVTILWDDYAVYYYFVL